MPKKKKASKTGDGKGGIRRKSTVHPRLKIKRYITIDALRGFAVLMMIFVSALYLLTYNVPFFLLHNQGDVFLFFDLVAPTFQFVLGMSLFLYILHRRAHGFSRKEIASQVLWRYLLLIALGFVLDAVTYLDFRSWGVLETLGVGGILTYFVANRTNNEKMLIAALILSVYSLLYYNPIFSDMISMPHGGPVGAIDYTVISIIGFMTAESLYKRKSDGVFFRSMLKYALAWIILGILLSAFIPFNKNSASPSFIMASTGIVMILYLMFFAIYKTRNYTFDRLRIFGRNALTMWVLQYMFGWIFLFIVQKILFLDFIPGLMAAILVTIFMYFVSVALIKRNVKISF